MWYENSCIVCILPMLIISFIGLYFESKKTGGRELEIWEEFGGGDYD